MPLWESGCTKS